MTAGRLFVALFLLLVLPATAEGWFDDSHLVIRLEHVDVEEAGSLISTLFPEVRFERFRCLILARGSSEDLDRVKTMTSELDRPLDRVFVEVILLEDRGGRESIPCIPLSYRTPYRYNPRSSVLVHQFTPVDPAVLCFQIEPAFHNKMELPLGETGGLILPNEAAREIFGSESIRLELRYEACSFLNYWANVQFKAKSTRWQGEYRQRCGESLIVCGPSEKWVILIRLSHVSTRVVEETTRKLPAGFTTSVELVRE